MTEPVELKYHAQAVRLLGLTPVVSAEAVRAITECELACKVRLPAAVREWYSLEGVQQALAERTGACGPTALRYILDEWDVFHPRDPVHDEDPRITLFTSWRENTGWDAELVVTGDDDPPVEADAKPPRVPFTHYVLNMAWWRATFNDQPSRLYGREANAPPAVFGPPHLDFLGEHFEEVRPDLIPWFNFAPDPPPPGFRPRTFRFFRPGWYVEVNTDGDPATGFRPAVYCLTADTAGQLRALDEFLWPCRDRGPTPG